MFCVLCNAEATLREKTRNGKIFCGNKCQFLHYAMIGAGGKRVRDNEDVLFTQFSDLPFETQVKVLLELDDFPTMLRMCRTNAAFREYCGERAFRQAYVEKHRDKMESYFLQTFQFGNIVHEQAQDLEPWLILLLDHEQYQAYPASLYMFVARHNLVQTAEVLIYKPQADWRQYFDAIAFYAIKEDHAAIVEAWLGHTIELMTYEDANIVPQHVDYLLQLCLSKQRERCYRLIVARNPLDLGSDELLRTIGNFPSSALEFLRRNIDLSQLRRNELSFLMERFAIRVQPDLFIHLVTTSQRQIPARAYYDLIRRLLYFEYSEALVQLITYLYSRVPNLSHAQQWEMWSRDGLSPNTIIFGIWLSHFRVELSYSIWAECILNMIQLRMSQELISMVINMPDAPIGEDNFRTEFKVFIFQFAREDIQLMLSHKRIRDLFDEAELHFYGE